MIFMKKIFFIIVCVLIVCVSCNQKKYRYHEGFIQGTTFHITYEHNVDLSRDIDSLLEVFNSYFSNYDSTSFISKINRNESDSLTPLMEKMFDIAFEVYKISDSVFDITIAPLANLWSCGWKKSLQNIPDSSEINSVLQYIGMDKINIENHKIKKKNPNITIIVNAIAQGLSCDYIAEHFDNQGVTNYLVEIGGEIFCKGVNSMGKKWSVGIINPETVNSAKEETEFVVELSGKSVCTSGNYRKFIEVDGKKYGHELNPKTGYPAENSLLSVSVIANSAMYADALSTAFMVLGLEKSIEIINSLPDVEAFFIYYDETGEKKSVFLKNKMSNY